MAEAARLLLVHDQPLLRECFVLSLKATERFSAIDFAGDCQEALARVRHERPDIVVADWLMPARGALELTLALRRDFPEVKVVILGADEAPETVRECAAAGAAGYVAHSDTFEHLVERLERVLRGELGYSPAITHALFSQLTELSQAYRRDDPAAADCILTFRELEILRLIADGLSNKQIAARLDLSLHTVKNHVHNLLEKLSAKGRYAAVRYAYERRWLKR